MTRIPNQEGGVDGEKSGHSGGDSASTSANSVSKEHDEEAPAEPSDGRSLRALRLRSERRTQILGIARTLFASRGYHETSIQDILDGADIARGTFYLHFESKRAIFDELIDDFLGRIRAVVTVVDLSPQAPPPLVQISENLNRVFAVLKKNRDMTRITLLIAEGLDAQCDAKMADFYGRLLELLRHALELGQHMHLVRPSDARVVAQVVLGGLKEVLMHWIVRRDSTDEEIEQVSRQILDYALHGLFLPATD